MEYIDLGRQEPDYSCEVMPSSKRKMKMGYPDLHCDVKLPINEKDVGKEVFAVVKLKITKSGKTIEDGKKPRYDNRFEVRKIKFPGKDISSVAGIKSALEQI